MLRITVDKTLYSKNISRDCRCYDTSWTHLRIILGKLGAFNIVRSDVDPCNHRDELISTSGNSFVASTVRKKNGFSDRTFGLGFVVPRE